MRTLVKSEGQDAVELSLQRIEMTRSSGKVSNKSRVAISGEFLFLFREAICSAVKSLLFFTTIIIV
jgi:hypothetical protein